MRLRQGTLARWLLGQRASVYSQPEIDTGCVLAEKEPLNQPSPDLGQARYLQVDIGLYEEDLDPEEASISPEFPGVDAEALTWVLVVDLRSGAIQDWPSSGHVASAIYLKVTDAGVYTLLDADRRPIVRKIGYVPDEVLPDSGGDYLDLRVDAQGMICDWLDEIDLSDFAPDEYGDSELSYPDANGEFVEAAPVEAGEAGESNAGDPPPPLTGIELREQRRAARRELRRQIDVLRASEQQLALRRAKEQRELAERAEGDLREPPPQY